MILCKSVLMQSHKYSCLVLSATRVCAGWLGIKSAQETTSNILYVRFLVRVCEWCGGVVRVFTIIVYVQYINMVVLHKKRHAM